MCYISFAAAILLAFIMTTNPLNKPHTGNQVRASVTKPEESIWDFRAMRIFPRSFWLICIICILLYGTVVPFNNIASDFLMSKWYPNDTETAGIVMRFA